MPIRGSPNGAAHSQCTLFHSHVLVDAIARNGGGRLQSVQLDVFNRNRWSPSLGAPTTDQGTREHLAAQIQMLALNEVTYVPWGEWDYPNLFRKSVRNVVQFVSTVFWNVRMA